MIISFSLLITAMLIFVVVCYAMLLPLYFAADAAYVTLAFRLLLIFDAACSPPESPCHATRIFTLRHLF